ncbi:replication protein A 32 kDa subunit-like [Uloborus diversus]|uniref:replication protein A 32 kDa subunit-like n=1 Tax=Uloborus diversus TaxID=327109 RepID=UPI00240A8844|nr:replication protein A 32 kDa subunit-like [Uloborus diversus]
MWNSMDEGGFGGKSRFEQSAGGGFLNTTISSPSTSEKKKPERLTNVVPCTIAQIHLMAESDDNLKIGSLTAKMITFVGLVQSVDIQTTKVTYVIDDCSGPGIEVQIWIGENEDLGKKVNVVQENTYARVTGAVRSMKGKRHVIAFNISPVRDANEITMHIAEVIHASMSVSVMDKQSSTGMASGFGSSSLLTSTGTVGGTSDTFGMNAGISRNLTKPQQLVLQAVNACKDEQGINTGALFASLKSLNRQSIQEALDFLSNEGHIYSTIDEDHYKSTDCV